MKQIATLLTAVLTTSFLYLAVAEDNHSISYQDIFMFPADAAMGGANLAFSRNGSGTGNPANLPLDSSQVVTLSYAGFYGNILSTSMLSFITPIMDNAGLGVSAAYLYIPDILVTRNLETDAGGLPIWDPNNLVYETSSEFLFSISFGQKFLLSNNMQLAYGASIHGKRLRLLDVSGYGMGLDAGMALGLTKFGLRFSLLINNITTNTIYWNSSYRDIQYPQGFIGIGWKKNIPYLYGDVVVAYKTPDLFMAQQLLVSRVSNKENVFKEKNGAGRFAQLAYASHYGFDYLINKTVALRFGFNEGKFDFGGGIELFSRTLCFDLCYTAFNLGGSYLLSTAYRW